MHAFILYLYMKYKSLILFTILRRKQLHSWSNGFFLVQNWYMQVDLDKIR